MGTIASPEDRLTVTVDADGSDQLVALAGELDPHTSPFLEDTLAGLTVDPGSTLTLDLAALDFIDSAGLRVLVKLYHRVTDGKATLRTCNVTPTTRKLLELTGLWEALSGEDEG